MCPAAGRLLIKADGHWQGRVGMAVGTAWHRMMLALMPGGQDGSTHPSLINRDTCHRPPERLNQRLGPVSRIFGSYAKPATAKVPWAGPSPHGPLTQFLPRPSKRHQEIPPKSPVPPQIPDP